MLVRNSLGSSVEGRFWVQQLCVRAGGGEGSRDALVSALGRALVLPTEAAAWLGWCSVELGWCSVEPGWCLWVCTGREAAGFVVPVLWQVTLKKHPRAWQSEQPLQDFVVVLRGNAGSGPGQVPHCAEASCHCQGVGSVLPQGCCQPRPVPAGPVGSPGGFSPAFELSSGGLRSQG